MSITDAAPASSRASSGRLVLLALANLPLAAISVAVFVFLPPYFAGPLGLGMTVVGLTWTTVRLIDIPIDVILAVMMDRTRTPLGRYRAWMLAGAPVLTVAIWRLFTAPKGVAPGFIVGWLLAMYLGNSMIGLALSAWGANLARHYHDRSRFFGVVTAVGVAGALSVLLAPILGRVFGADDAAAVRGMGWGVALSIPVSVGLAAAFTPERLGAAVKHENFALKDVFSVLSRPDILRLFLAQMALTLGPGWMSATYLFFFRDARGFSTQQASILLAAYILAGVPGALGASALARRIGKHRALIATTSGFSVGLLAVLITPRANLAAGMPLMIWSGMMASGFGLTINAMLADVGDEVRLDQGQERMSLIYALNALGSKVAAALSIGLTYPLLARLGYDPAAGSANTPAALLHLTQAFIGGPILFVSLGGACVIGWRLDAKRQMEVRAALDERDRQAAVAGESR